MSITQKSSNQPTQLAIDFHCHGIGRFDFTDLDALDLQEVEGLLAKRQHCSILTIYLPKNNYHSFFSLMDRFSLLKSHGKLPHISGIAIEGPLLSSRGGTPENSTWVPSKRQWQQLASCGKQGLVYIILSPDAPCFDQNHESNNLDSPAPSIEWVCETLLQEGVLPSPGHFAKDDPKQSMKALQALFDTVHAFNQVTVTDHFLNDMPHNFTHAWRNEQERQHRLLDLENINPHAWHIDHIEEQLGLLPATMIRNAHRGVVKICQNFDGLAEVFRALYQKTFNGTCLLVFQWSCHKNLPVVRYHRG